jgi:DNA topoisomerase-1
VFDEDPTVKVLKGRWGPYVVVGKQNVRLPKGTDAAALTLDECLQLAQQQAPAPKAKKGAASKKSTEDGTGKKTAAKKTAVKKVAKKTAAKKTAVKKSVKKG